MVIRILIKKPKNKFTKLGKRFIIVMHQERGDHYGETSGNKIDAESYR